MDDHAPPLTVRSGSAEKVYDETPLTNREWSILSGELAVGDTLSGDGTSAITNQGSCANELAFTVKNAQGKDVSSNYELTVEAGTLTVHPIVLRFGAENYERVYDGTWKKCKTWLISGSVLSGHQLVYEGERLWNAGVYEKAVVVNVYNSAGDDVTEKGYKIEIEGGTVTIHKRPITVASGSAEKLYDGKPLKCQEYKLVAGTLAHGESIRLVKFTGEQTAVGSSLNYYMVNGILDRYAKNCVKNYEITYEYGTLRVLASDFSKDSPSSCNNCGVCEECNGGAPPDPEEGTTIGYPNCGDEVRIYAVVTNIEGLSYPSSFYFRSASYGDYTGSGWTGPKTCDTVEGASPLTYVGSLLEDTGQPGVSMEIRRYDGCPAVVPYYLESADLFDNSKSDCYFKTDERNYRVTCYREDSYQYLAAKATNTPEEATYREFVYENYLQIPQQTKTQLLDWAEEQGINPDSPTLVKHIQQAVRSAATYNKNGEAYPAGVDVAVYFLTQAKEGICQHFATAATLLYRAYGIPARYTTGYAAGLRSNGTTALTNQNSHAWVEIYVDGVGWMPIEVTGTPDDSEEKPQLHLQACGATKYYDGMTFEEYDLAQYVIVWGELKEDHRLEVTCQVNEYLAEPGVYLNIIRSCKVFNGQGEDVSDEYDLVCFAGELKILKRPITIATGSETKVKDGTPLSCDDYWIAEGTLAPNERLTVRMGDTQIVQGKGINTTSWYSIEREVRPGVWEYVRDYYEISWIYGTLEITEPEN